MARDQALFEYLLRLGDNCLILSQRLSEWCGRSPVLEEDIALTNVGLGIKAGSILSSVSGFSVYEFGDATQQPPLFRIALGNTNLADMATP